MKKRFYKVVPVILLILTILCNIFIFGNSMSDGDESSEQSGRVVTAVINIADAVGIEIEDIDTFSYNIRKSAHFLEFALLGLFSFLTLVSFEVKPLKSAIVSLFYCTVVAATDEYIQTFYEGRVGHIDDVLIDFLGALTTVAICFIIVCIIKKRFNKLKKKN